MAETTTNQPAVDFRTEPARYKHWRLAFDGPVATLTMDVQEDGGLRPGYELKLNSYDLGVDIELYDALQRLRFGHPEVGAVILTSGKERIFCAGANIRMLGQSSHGFKVNFCKFTNETRNAIEEAAAESRQVWICAINGPCAGGGYELALACERIIMADDGNTSVALPETPLLAVLPGTGGATPPGGKRHRPPRPGRGPSPPPPRRCGGDPRAGRPVLAAGAGASAGRSDPPSEDQRRADRSLGVQDRRQRRSGRSLRSPAGRSAGRLAGARDPSLSQADAEADRRLGALNLRADRAGLLLRRDAARAGAGRRPLLHAGRRPGGRQP